MTDKTTELIAEARTWPRDGVNEGPLINALADALEAEHQRADHGWSMVYIERENVRIEYERRTAVEAERDALHAAIRDTPQREYPLTKREGGYCRGCDALIEGVKFDARNSMRSDPRVWHEALDAALDKVLPGFWDAVRAVVLAEQGEPEWEYGVEYEASSTESVFTAAHSEAMARKWVEESPTDTGLRRRRPAGPWLPVEENGENDG